MKKIRLHIKDKNSRWKEIYHIEDELDPIKYGLDIINTHNRGLYPFEDEYKRKLVYVEEMKEEVKR